MDGSTEVVVGVLTVIGGVEENECSVGRGVTDEVATCVCCRNRNTCSISAGESSMAIKSNNRVKLAPLRITHSTHGMRRFIVVVRTLNGLRAAAVGMVCKR